MLWPLPWVRVHSRGLHNRGLQRSRPRVKPKFTFYVPENVGGCEGMNPQAPKWALTLGIGVSQPHFGISVRMKLTLPKVGSWSPLGLPKTQSSIIIVKTPCIEVFFMSLERSWSVDVQNGLVWAIWTSAAQIMVERRAGSQTANLTPDH